MRINNNIQALNAYRNLNANQFKTSKNLEKLSSGLRINRAADDAAGLAISEKMRSQIRGLKQAERNSMDGISLMQTAEGALQEVHAMLQRMRELAVQGANDTNTEYDREQIQKEIEQLKLEIDSVSEKTEFNTRKLLNGSSAVLSSISEAADNGANVVGNPKVIDPRLETGVYHMKVQDTKEIVKINQVGAGISNTVDIALDPDSTFFPQAFGEYTINVRSFLKNEANNTIQHSATVQVIGPNGLPLEERSVAVNTEGDIFTIGGLNINTKNIREAGTIKVSIEQEATFSVYRGDAPSDDTKIAAHKTLTTRNGVIRHGGVEFKFDNSITEDGINGSQATGTATIGGTPGTPATVTVPDYDGTGNNVDVTVTGGEHPAYDAITIKFDNLAVAGAESATFAEGPPAEITISLETGKLYSETDIATILANITGDPAPANVDFSEISIGFTGNLDADGAAGGSSLTLAGGVEPVGGKSLTINGGKHEAYNGLEIEFDKSAAAGSESASFAAGPPNKLTISLATGKNYNQADIAALLTNITGDPAPADVNFSQIAINFTGNLAADDLDGKNIALANGKAPVSDPLSDNITKFSITNNALAFQIGPNTNQNVMIDVPRLDIVTLGIEEIDVTSQIGANNAIFILDQAINILSDVRAKLGATQNRMEHTINNLQVTHENLTASESRIRDADMALEMTEFTRNNILNQSATAMLAQANQLPQGVLQLLQ